MHIQGFLRRACADALAASCSSLQDQRGNLKARSWLQPHSHVGALASGHMPVATYSWLNAYIWPVVCTSAIWLCMQATWLIVCSVSSRLLNCSARGYSDLCSFILAGVEAQVDVLAPWHPYPRLPAACPDTYTSLTSYRMVKARMQCVCHHVSSMPASALLYFPAPQ